MVAAGIDGEGVAGRGRERQRVHQVQSRAGRDALHRRAHVGVGPRSEDERALSVLRCGDRGQNLIGRRARARVPGRGIGSPRHAASGVVEGMNAGRRPEVARHVVLQDHEVARDRDRRPRPADIVDGRDLALKHDHAADNRSGRRGQENAIANDLGAVESSVPKGDQKRRAVDQIGRPGGDRDLLLVDVEPDGPFVLEAGDQRSDAVECIAVIDDRIIDVRPCIDGADRSR